jgi:hypothetical protein
MSRKLPICLEYAGALGHEYVVTLERDGNERVRLETDDIASARREYAECVNPTTLPRIYRRTKMGWRLTA